MKKGGYTYILTSQRNGTLYIGVTASLANRIDQHKAGATDSFTRKYSVYSLVWYEQYDTIEEAIAREKQLKRWNRAWKLELIEKENPLWNDLADTLLV